MVRFLIVKTHFDAAHSLDNYKGKCAQLHGHRWNVEVTVSGEKNEDTGMVCDFSELKNYIEMILPDHEHLNEIYDFSPTAENLADHFFVALRDMFRMNAMPLILVSVAINETPDCSAVVVNEAFRGTNETCNCSS